MKRLSPAERKAANRARSAAYKAKYRAEAASQKWRRMEFIESWIALIDEKQSKSA